MYGVIREYKRVADRQRVEVVHLLFLLSRDDEGEGIGNDNDNDSDNDNNNDNDECGEQHNGQYGHGYGLGSGLYYTRYATHSHIPIQMG